MSAAEDPKKSTAAPARKSDSPPSDAEIQLLRDKNQKLESALREVEGQVAAMDLDKIKLAKEENAALKMRLSLLAQVLHGTLAQQLQPGAPAELASQEKSLREALVRYCASAKIDLKEFPILKPPEKPPEKPVDKTLKK